MNRFAFAAAVAAVTFGLGADTVELKSGSILKGEAGVLRDGKLTFKTEDFGEVKIDIAKIVKIDVEKDHVIQHPDNTKDTVKLGIADGKLVREGRPLDMSTVKATDPEVEKWHGSINGAFTAARGNTYENSWSVFGDISRRWEKDRFTADGGYYYSETGTYDGDDKKRSTDRWEIHGQHDHFWWPKFYGFEMGRVERDMLKGLRARYELGIGPGYQWLDKTDFATTGKWSFKQQIAVKWTKEDREDSDDVKEYGYAALSYEHHLGWITKWNPNLEFFHDFRYDPSVEDWDKYVMKADLGFTTKLIYDFTFTGKIEWDYDSQPSEDREKSDVRYIAGLGYKW